MKDSGRLPCECLEMGPVWRESLGQGPLGLCVLYLQLFCKVEITAKLKVRSKRDGITRAVEQGPPGS